jgi:bacillithiol system protein YtxJ
MIPSKLIYSGITLNGLKLINLYFNYTMGFFNKLFGDEGNKLGSEPIKKAATISWIPLTSVQQLEEIAKSSSVIPAGIFKHSTRCGISRMVMKQFEQEFTLPSEAIDMYYLDLLNFREISNEIISRFKVAHESPQLIIIKEGKAVYNNSHSEINASHIDQFI